MAATHSSWWAVVREPTTAMLASAKRIKGQCLSATSFKTDVGRMLDLLLDPPVVVANEVRGAVRRARWNQVGHILPGLIPAILDVGTSAPQPDDQLVPCCWAHQADVASQVQRRACLGHLWRSVDAG